MQQEAREDLLASLEAMGFDQELSRRALVETRNRSLDAALDYLYKATTSNEPTTTSAQPTKNNSSDEAADSSIPENATSLADFGYGYNEKGQLRHLETGEAFKFINQKHYEAMGEMIVRHIQERLIKDHDMEEIIVPIHEVSYEMPRSSIFVSKGALSSTSPLVILVHGSGNVRAGQWARKPCFNDDLSIGSVLPYVERAHAKGMNVVVLNPNLNHGMVNGRKVDIEGNSSPEAHLLYVWDKFISSAPAEHLFFVSHSYGGIATINLIEHRDARLLKRLRALALTDSMHFFSHRGLSRRALEWLATNCIDWVTSELPLDTAVNNGADCYCCSAGTLKHEHTSGTAVDSVFNFFDARLEIAMSQQH
ncbi:Arb2 domain-containing protein [Balamuthia mandrillaris]